MSGDEGGEEEFRILDDVDGLVIEEERAAAILLLFWPEMEAAMATRTERVGLIVGLL